MERNKLITILFAGVLILVLIIGIAFKKQMNDFISRNMQNATSQTEKFEAEKYIETAFNYSENGKNFDFTLLQFKSAGCTICKQMEPVIEEIKNWNDKKINVQVIQIMNPDSQELMKYFGISTVPMLVVLNKSGQEVSRTYGFIEGEALKAKF